MRIILYEIPVLSTFGQKPRKTNNQTNRRTVTVVTIPRHIHDTLFRFYVSTPQRPFNPQTTTGFLLNIPSTPI